MRVKKIEFFLFHAIVAVTTFNLLVNLTYARQGLSVQVPVHSTPTRNNVFSEWRKGALAKKQAKLDRSFLKASRLEDYKKMDQLMKKGANVNAAGQGGYTPLHLAAMNGKTKMAAKLIEIGADINSKDEEGRTPLHYAAAAGIKGTHIVDKLIKSGGNVNAKDRKGLTPLHFAAIPGRKANVGKLIEAKAEVDAIDGSGLTPLQYAAELGHTESVEKLVNGGANPNVKGKNGMTPLHHVVKQRDPRSTSILTLSNANPNAQNDEGFTPLDLVDQQRNPGYGVRDALVRVGAQHGPRTDQVLFGESDELKALKGIKERMRLGPQLANPPLAPPISRHQDMQR